MNADELLAPFGWVVLNPTPHIRYTSIRCAPNHVSDLKHQQTIRNLADLAGWDLIGSDEDFLAGFIFLLEPRNPNTPIP